ncbi:MAG: CcmD family protein [Deltaproteobacteria bacterium]|nr:CcmD family protein [Deltaproteobacteria bacterium]
MKLLYKFIYLFQIVTLFCTLLQPAGPAAAQSAQPGGQIDERNERRFRVFEAVEGMQVEEVSGAKLLLVAYTIFWLLLFVYIIRIARLQAKTRGEIERLQKMLASVQERRVEEDQRE